MKAFFAALSRNVGTMLLSLAIVLGLSYYLLAYVPERTASLNARYFRVLARIGYNVKEKIKAQHLNDEGDARSLAHLMSYRLRSFAELAPGDTLGWKKDSVKQFVKAANQILANRSGPEKYHLKTARDTGMYKHALRLVGSQFEFTHIVPPSPVEGQPGWLSRMRATNRQPASSLPKPLVDVTEASAAGSYKLAVAVKSPPAPAAATEATTYALTHTIPVDTLLRELRRPDVFDYFFVVELPSHRLLYSSDQPDFYLASTLDKTSQGRLPRWLTDSSLVHSGRAGAYTFGGQAYQLFAQPVRLGSRLNCLLVGGVQSRRFDTERRALPAGWPELILGLGLLGVLALPFLKLRLMSPREHIHRRDVLLSAASLVLGSGVLLLTLQAAVSGYESDSLIKKQLADLAEEVANDLHDELRQLNTAAWEVDDELRRGAVKYPASAYASGLVNTIPLSYSLVPTYLERRHFAGNEPDYFTWVTKEGQAQHGLNPVGPPPASPRQRPEDALTKTLRLSNCLPGLGQRQYLQQLNRGSYQLVRSDFCQPDPDQAQLALDEARQASFFGRTAPPLLASPASLGGPTDSCYFQMLRIVRNTSSLRAPYAGYGQDGLRLKAILARPSRWNEDMVCVFETRLVSFDDKITPPGYGFCLIEPNGEVMAHSVPDLNLSENLLTDCEPSRELRAVLHAQQQQPGQAIEVTYQGRPTLLYVRPLAGMQRYLITFFDMSYAKAQQSQTSLLASTLLGGFWLLLAVVALLNWLVLRVLRPRSSRDRFQSLWPHPGHAARYWQVVAGQAVGLVVLAVAATQVGPLSQLALLLVVPLPLFVLTYYHTRLPATSQHGIFRWVVGLVAVMLGGLLLLHWHVVGGSETGWLLGAAVVMSGLVYKLLPARLSAWFVLARQRIPFQHWDFSKEVSAKLAPISHYRTAYIVMLLGWTGLLGIVPALSCYRAAYLVEQLQKVRAGQLQLLQACEHYQTQHRALWLSTPVLPAPWVPSDARYQAWPPATKNQYKNHFYYHANFFFTSSLELLPVRSTTHSSAPADLGTLSFFTFLRRPITRAGEEGAKALFTDLTGNAQWHPWQVSSLAGDTLTLTTWDNASRSQVTSRIGGLRLDWPHTKGVWVLWLVFILVAIGLVGGLGMLIAYLLRRLFGLSDAPASPPLLEAPAPPQTPARCFWVVPAGSAWADVPAWAQQTLGQAVVVPDYKQDTLKRTLTRSSGPAAIVLDCRRLFGPAPYTDPNDAMTALLGQPAPTTWPAALIISYFDYNATDAALTQCKSTMLLELQQRGWPLVVLSASHPDAFGYCGHPLEKPCPDPGPEHRKIREAGERLLDALAEFQMEYFALQSATPESAPPEAEKNLFAENLELETYFKQECQAFPFVASLRPVLLAKLWQQKQAGQLLTQGAIETAIQRLAQFHFRRLWLALSPQEKFLLYDLAQDGLVNIDNTLALSILLQKGFLCRANNGRLSLRSASFRGFILTAQRKHEAMQYVAASEQGTWAATQTPLLLLLAAGALFMFITQPTTFTQTQTFLLGLASLLPALAGLFRFLLAPKPAASAAGN